MKKIETIKGCIGFSRNTADWEYCAKVELTSENGQTAEFEECGCSVGDALENVLDTVVDALRYESLLLAETSVVSVQDLSEEDDEEEGLIDEVE